ncbi:MAG: apolipoprotein N-acyltransferase [Acidobacteria bacterium]|nr:apolipoprotein N-acyltransferase [Acidobacteriota bacterium]
MLLALSFPRFGHPAFAWIALVPLALAVSGWAGRPGVAAGRPGGRAFLLGLLAGVVYFVGTLYWTGSVVSTFGGLSAGLAVVSVLLLALYLAIYPACAALVVSRLARRSGASALLMLPPAWVATEYLRGVLFGGFPWVPLGSSQVTVLPVAQVASLVGVYGVSALVALVNAALAWALLTSGRARSRALVLTGLLLLAVSTWGSWRVSEGSLTRAGVPLRVGLLQGNIAQEDKWDPAEARRILTTYIAMTRDAVRQGAGYVIWPESSTPFMFEENSAGEQAVRAVAREVQVPVLFGSDQVVRDGPPRLYNAAFLLGPDGGTTAVYRKIHLVPFGEYIPLKEWLYFVSPIVETFLDFSPGESVTLLPVAGRPTSTAICYEVVYPSLIREAVVAGSQLLSTITNDAWYGDSSAPHQHFALASMRAVEQGRYLVRAANTGISGIVDPYGRVTARSALFEEATIIGDVRLLEGRTFYSVVGDIVAYLALALTAASLLVSRRR